MCLLIITPNSYAQEFLSGTTPVMYELEIELRKSPHVKVIFEVQNFRGLGHLEIWGDKHENLNVYTERLELVEYELDGDTFENSKYIKFSEHPNFGEQKGDELFVEYLIHDYIQLKDQLWTGEFRFPHDVTIDLYDYNDWVFVNSNAVLLPPNAGKLNCIGCQLTVEFFNDESLFTRTQSVSLNEKTIDTTIMSDGYISDFNFDESLKLISFDLEKKNQIVVMGIPFELLLNPYRVYLTSSDTLELDPYDQIKNSEMTKDKSGILSFRPTDTGMIYIQGATEEEHKLYAEYNKPEPALTPPMQQTNEIPDTSILHSPENKEDLTWSEIMEMEGIGEETDQLSLQYFYLVPVAMIVMAVVFGIFFSLRKKTSVGLKKKNRV